MLSLVCLYRGSICLSHDWDGVFTAGRWRPRVFELGLAFALMGFLLGLSASVRWIRAPRRRGTLLALLGLFGGPFWMWTGLHFLVAPQRLPQPDPEGFELPVVSEGLAWRPDRELYPTIVIYLEGEEWIIRPHPLEHRALDWKRFLGDQISSMPMDTRTADGTGPTLPDGAVLLRVDRRAPMAKVLEVQRYCAEALVPNVGVMARLDPGALDAIYWNYRPTAYTAEEARQLDATVSELVGLIRVGPGEELQYELDGRISADFEGIAAEPIEEGSFVSLAVDPTIPWGQLAPLVNRYRVIGCVWGSVDE